MTPFQRGEAIDVLLMQTEASSAEIEQQNDIALEAWLYELGYDWDGYAWVLADEDEEMEDF